MLVEIPYRPRKWAEKFHESTKRLLALVLHRRAGKTTAVINHHLRQAAVDQFEAERLKAISPNISDADLKELLRPPGGRHYGHILPLHVQAKSVAWDKLKYYASAIPGIKINESELLIRIPAGKFWNKVQLFGADNPDAFRGMAFSGLSFDEYSQMHPAIFSEVLSKALADHLGYAIFCGTIKGKDHLYKNYQVAQESPEEWFSLWQDIDKSLATEEGITIKTLETALADDRRLVEQGLMTLDELEQEWYLSIDAAIKGAFYLKEMSAATKEGRVTNVPYDPNMLVDTDWDLGMSKSDAMTCIYSQSTKSGEIRIIDYHEAYGEAFPYHVKILNAKGYAYGKHYPPHDASIKEMSTGKSRVEVARDLGLRFEWPEQNPGLEAGIHAARLMIPRCWFDAKRAERLIECLRHYRKKFNNQLQEFTGTPVHNWACFSPDTKVLTRSGIYQIMDLPINGEVLTPCGWKQYQGPKITRRNAQLVAVRLSDGSTVKCTPDHQWLTASGWKSAESLMPDMQIRSCSIRYANTSMGGFTGDGPRRDISPGVANIYIEMSGRQHSDPSLTDATSITEMETLSTIVSQILSASLPQIIFQPNGSFMLARESIISRQQLEARLPNGIAQRLVGLGIADMQEEPKVGPSGSVLKNLVITVENWLKCLRGLAMPRSIAPKHAKPLHIVSVMPLSERVDTWCINVPDIGCFTLANGAIVSNSHGADAFRGLSVRHRTPEQKRIYPSPQMSDSWTWC